MNVPFDGYRGADPRRRRKADEYNRVAARVRDYLNELAAKWDDNKVGSIMSFQVAAAICEDSDLVQKIISGIGGGSTGVTIRTGPAVE